eukprot:1188262-Prorocentrum_minimum.AAC.4
MMMGSSVRSSISLGLKFRKGEDRKRLRRAKQIRQQSRTRRSVNDHINDHIGEVKENCDSPKDAVQLPSLSALRLQPPSIFFAG